MGVENEVRALVDEVLSLKGGARAFARDTPLLGALPELDSMAVANLLTEMEDRLGIIIDDSDVDGDLLGTFGALLAYAEAKRAAA